MIPKPFGRFALALFVLILIACESNSSRDIRDLIPPLALISGQTDTVRASDLFYAEDYDLEFLPHPRLQTRYQRENQTLLLRADPDFEGMTLLGFKYKGTVYHLPVSAEIRQSFTFRYRPAQAPQQLTLFGSFNSWNRSSLPLRDEDGDGLYEIRIPLEPGRYEYKFFVDGEEVLDPENPDRIPNPFGSFNSVITAAPRHTGKSFLHLLNAEITPSETQVFFMYEQENQPESLAKEHLIALLDNEMLAAERIQIRGNRITIALENYRLFGERVLRVGASREGLNTPLQTVRLINGQPAGRAGETSGWDDAVIYSIMIDRFFDGDPANTRPVQHPELSPKANFMGGDLQGILDKLQAGYFDSLGVNALWISPVNQNTPNAHREWPEPHRYFSAYHGYWPIHHQKVDERFGSMELLQKLVAEAHRRGMKVLLDFVANHTHIDHPFFQEHRDWYGTLDLPDGRKNIRFWDEFRLTTWFEPFLPSFDYLGSPAALQAMTDNAVWWLKEADLDGFRHDAVKHIPNEFWRELTRKIKQQVDVPGNRKTFQIGETFGGYDLISSYVNNGQLDAQFNFNLFFTARHVFLAPEANFSILAEELRKTASVYGMAHRMGNLMDSHDQVRYLAYTDGDISLGDGDAAEIGWNNPPEVDHEQSYEKAQLYLAYLLTIPGLPTLYYGDEIGMTGAADPDNRRMMRFGEQLTPAERRMFREVSRLVKLRREHSALRYGDFQTLYADQNCFAYLRSDFNQRILIALNKSEQPQAVELALPGFYGIEKAKNLLSGEEIAVSGGRLALAVPGIGWRVLEIR